MPRDHKIVTDGQEHPLRPVCGANSGPGYRISNILAQVISPCNDAASGPDILESTEDLQSCFQVFNSLPAEERKGLIVFSMDATALYPSILVQRSSEVVYELMAETSIVFKSIDDLELQRYAAMVLDYDVLLKYDLLDYVMKCRYSLT